MNSVAVPPFRVLQSPAEESAIIELLRKVGGTLPSAYLDFLRVSDGAECGPNDCPGDSLRILSANEVGDYGAGYGVDRELPELFCFASDGGDHAFAFLRESSISPEDWPIVRIPLGALFRFEIMRVADSFNAWIESNYAYEVD